VDNHHPSIWAEKTPEKLAYMMADSAFR